MYNSSDEKHKREHKQFGFVSYTKMANTEFINSKVKHSTNHIQTDMKNLEKITIQAMQRSRKYKALNTISQVIMK